MIDPREIGPQADHDVVLPVIGKLRFAALSVPGFRWYWVASWISGTGDGMENVIRNLLIISLIGAERAPFWLGMMVFAHWVPFTVFSLYGGTLADRYDNRKVQIVSQLILMGAAAGTAVATLTGFVTLWWLFGMLLLHGFAGAIGNPAQQTLIHALVGRDKLLSAVSLNSMARQFSQVIGPAIAGVIYLAFGAGWGFVVNALTFIPLLIVLSLVRVPRLHEWSPQPILRSLREGVDFLRRRPQLAALISVEALPVVFLGHTFTSLVPVFAVAVLGAGELGYAFLLVASGLGAIAAVVYLGLGREPRRAAAFIVGAAFVEMAAIMVFSFSRSYVLSLGLMFVIGAAAVITQALTNTTLQLSAPDRLRGRVMGTYSFATQGLRVINGPLLGGAATVLGAPAAVASAAAIVLAGLGGIVARVPELRPSIGAAASLSGSGDVGEDVRGGS
ncbi:MAG TPA: MFS transporter [Candidatus Limnocylindria bacterium]|jgi:MFS family permease|nr:MFS transporter [Candidatus Limnocylindria bacterium]